jgi:hypothetical protein
MKEEDCSQGKNKRKSRRGKEVDESLIESEIEIERSE